jgi:sugar phosphate permease
VFYLFGVLGFIWGAWWGIGYMNDKTTDARETPEEKEAREAKEAAGEKAAPIPIGKFFKNKSFWALMAAHFTWNYFSYGLLAWLPSFLSSSLNVTLAKSSFLSILPYLATVAVTTIVAPTADGWEKNGMTRTNVRKLSQTLCFGGGAVCLALVGLVVNSTPPEAVTQTTVITVMSLLTVCFGMGAWVRTGLFCGHQDMSPKYASVMLGITNTAAAIASTLSTFFTGYFFSVSGGSWGWSLFFPIAALQAITVLLFTGFKSDPVDFDAA